MKFYGILHRTVLLQSKLINIYGKYYNGLQYSWTLKDLKKNLLKVLLSLFFYNTK